MKNVISMLQKLFGFEPPFKLEEFLAPSTAIERKVSFLLNLIKKIKEKDEDLREIALSGGKKSAAAQPNIAKSKQKQVHFRPGEDSVAGIPSSHL